jgi:uncharacterized DUF497 family protein
MKISYDEAKRRKTLFERGLDFNDVPQIFDNPVFEWEDKRFDYGETRILCFGVLHGRMVVVGYVPRGDVRHIFTMRKANEREQEKFRKRLEEAGYTPDSSR